MMMVQEYLNTMKEIQSSLLLFISEENGSEDNYSNFMKYFKDDIYSYYFNKYKEILFLFSKITNNHHRSINFCYKIERILIDIQDLLKQNYSNFEIYQIFKNNNQILLLLITNKIMQIDDLIFISMLRPTNKYLHQIEFFLPELKSFLTEKQYRKEVGKIKFIENINMDDPDDVKIFESKRKIGENGHYICELIRNDSIELFIQFINKNNISPSSIISCSIFETNLFLLKKKKMSLIEYSSFFGSNQIFKYLVMNKVNLDESIWFYGIHSKNAETIVQIEEIIGKQDDDFYIDCFKDSLKCHHNSFSEYIINKYLNDVNYDYSVKYMNFQYFPKDLNNQNVLYYLCKYDCYELVKLISPNNLETGKKIIQIASNQNNYDLVQYLLENKESSNKLFEKNSFVDCSSMIKITIPPNIVQIGKKTFFNNMSLTIISIPSSVTSINSFSFENCRSLKKISIPDSVKSIGDCSFIKCLSLEEITIPPFLESVGNRVFSDCRSLKQISFPSTIVRFGYGVFEYCTSLIEVTISSMIHEIGTKTFYKCKSLKHFSIPPSVTSIGWHSFQDCVSLTHLDIPDLVRTIGGHSFSGCSSLKSIKIPNLVTIIKIKTFESCRSLSGVILPDNLDYIETRSFKNCKSLTKIVFPSSIRHIEINSFEHCSSVTGVYYKNKTGSNCKFLDMMNDCKYSIYDQDEDNFLKFIGLYNPLCKISQFNQ